MTFNDGCLGSRNDEERSEMRYVMRIADSVNHQTFERTLRFREMPGAILFECLFSPISSDRSLWAFDGSIHTFVWPQEQMTYLHKGRITPPLCRKDNTINLKPQIKIEDPLN